jgi:hypothetical protein
VRKDELPTRIMFLCCGILFFGTGMYCFDVLSTFQIVGFFLTALACVVGSLVSDSFEFEFDPGERRLTLIEEIGAFGRKRTFDFDSIRAIRRQAWTIEEDDAPPRERFHVFLQIGEEELRLSPKELSRAQADELQNAVTSVLGTPVPLLVCGKNNYSA